jgi:hypothetical protein
MLELQEVGVTATVSNTQKLAETSKSQAWLDSMREELSSLINH